ncbi:exosortase-associated EpsI family protein [Botrimarina sp.]|uniref:exosortase-associated EpsI family protein n=1 Tax=Botrimarina sp. TaxID=2795802 RepID=UPI0032ED0E35
MLRVLPVVLAVLAIATLTVVQGFYTERWVSSEHAAYSASLLNKVPKQIGEWEGTESEVDDDTLETAGADGYVSRGYTNPSSGKSVGVWLIVGHARDTARHTPDVCYRASGYKPAESQDRQYLTLDDGREVSFFTNLFERQTPAGGMERQRVFWTWFKPAEGSGEPVTWFAPKNVRYEIGAAPALYKLYFTVSGEEANKPPEDSVALDFAKTFIAATDPILSKANGEVPPGFQGAEKPDPPAEAFPPSAAHPDDESTDESTDESADDESTAG